MRFVGRLLLIGVLMSPAAVWAAHPLITDDAGTQEKGNFQFELNGQYDSDEETVSDVNVKSTGWQVGTTLSYGIIDTVDLVLSLPYQWGEVKEDGFTAYDEKGISDTVFEVKWQFFEKDGLGLALKPGVRFPTGDDRKRTWHRKNRISSVFHRFAGNRSLGVSPEPRIHRKRKRCGRRKKYLACVSGNNL